MRAETPELSRTEEIGNCLALIKAMISPAQQMGGGGVQNTPRQLSTGAPGSGIPSQLAGPGATMHGAWHGLGSLGPCCAAAQRGPTSSRQRVQPQCQQQGPRHVLLQPAGTGQGRGQCSEVQIWLLKPVPLCWGSVPGARELDRCSSLPRRHLRMVAGPGQQKRAQIKSGLGERAQRMHLTHNPRRYPWPLPSQTGGGRG